VLDPGAAEKAKEKKWDRAQLNKHLKGTVHSRREQIILAFNAVKKANLGIAPCPLCPEITFMSSASWLKHCKRLCMQAPPPRRFVPHYRYSLSSHQHPTLNLGLTGLMGA
jgi:hypothetical protein